MFLPNIDLDIFGLLDGTSLGQPDLLQHLYFWGRNISLYFYYLLLTIYPTFIFKCCQCSNPGSPLCSTYMPWAIDPLRVGSIRSPIRQIRVILFASNPFKSYVRLFNNPSPPFFVHTSRHHHLYIYFLFHYTILPLLVCLTQILFILLQVCYNLYFSFYVNISLEYSRYSECITHPYFTPTIYHITVSSLDITPFSKMLWRLTLRYIYIQSYFVHLLCL